MLSLATACLALSPLLATPQGEPWKQSELEELSRRLQGEVAELRGARFVRDVAVKVASKDDLIEYMKRRMQEDEPPEKLAADETIAKLLGLFPADKDVLEETFALLESQVGGFYDPPSNTFYLMEGMPRGFAAPILAHELIHALDDQLYDIDAQMQARKDNSDAMQAYRFVVEGSGTAGGNGWTMAHMDQVDMSGFQDLMDAQQEGLLRAPSFLWKPLLGAYMQGSAFLARTDNVLIAQTKPLVPQDVAAAFTDLPRSTEQVLHPEKYWNPEQRDEPRGVTFETEALPSGWSVLREDTFGELGLAQVVEAGQQQVLDMSNPLSILAIEYTNAVAEGWGGDRVVLASDGQGYWLRLVTCWDSELDAAEFYGAMTVQRGLFASAARALSEDDSGVELSYGAEPDQVVLTIWSGVKRSTQRRLERGLGFSVAPP